LKRSLNTLVTLALAALSLPCLADDEQIRKAVNSMFGAQDAVREINRRSTLFTLDNVEIEGLTE
jgi:hypothetical protein